jgi:hypothetical protein
MAFLTQNKAKLWKKFNRDIGFLDKRQFFADNCQKSQKIMIITSTSDVLKKVSISFKELQASCQQRNGIDPIEVSIRRHFLALKIALVIKAPFLQVE